MGSMLPYIPYMDPMGNVNLPDFAKPWFMKIRGTPPIVISSDT